MPATVSETTLNLLLSALAQQVDFGVMEDELRMQIYIARRLKTVSPAVIEEARGVLSLLVAQQAARETVRH